MRSIRPASIASLLSVLTAAAYCILAPCLAAGSETTLPAPYLRMPDRADGALPKLLSQTGAFKDTRRLIPADGLIAYDLIVPFWSDGALKSRLMALPAGGKIGFSATEDWTFPNGTVFIKTFELVTDEAHPQTRRRLETRLLVRSADGHVYGVLYKWRADGSDADLLTTEAREDIPIKAADGRVRRQIWYYPSRKDCLSCHNEHTTGVLGPKARQLDCDLALKSGVSVNQLIEWSSLGLFTTPVTDSELPSIPRLAAGDDTTRTLEDRARSYLDANCAHCHRPGGTVADFDARYSTPLSEQKIVNGPVLIDQGIDRPRVVSPRDIWRSIAYMRVNTNGDIRMPPLARQTIDERGVELLKAWIESLPGKDVLAPPRISPETGTFAGPVTVTLTEPEPGAEIRYTLDGSVPTASDTLYDKPITLTGPTVVQARAFKDGFTRSIISQAVLIVGQ